MRMIFFFIGFLFIFIDWPVALLSGTLDVFPNLVGYLLILRGAQVLKPESRHFSLVMLLCAILGTVSAAELVLSLVGLLSNSTLAAILSLVMTLAFLYLSYEIYKGTKEMEARRNRPIGADKLLTAWGFLCLGSLFVYVPLFLPSMYLTCVLLQLLSYGWFEYSLYLIFSKTR